MKQNFESRLQNDKDSLEQDFINYLRYHLGRELTSDVDYKMRALILVIRARLVDNWRQTWASYHKAQPKRGYYLSMEFLIGRTLGNNLLNLGLEEDVAEALQELGQDLEAIEAVESDAGLGNGGLGRLAACFIDSCATLQLPVMGYGLRYEYGMFRQLIQNGFQVEEPDHWLAFGSYPWELKRAEYTRTVRFGGYCRDYVNPETGVHIVHWEDAEEVLAVPFDVPIPGYKNQTVNTLRLWHAKAQESFKLNAFNAGSYFEAVAAKNEAENITMVLYPNDSSESGKELRLRQQYFLVSASLQDVLANWERFNEGYETFAENNVFQLNDTHPSLAVAELMRLLIDEKRLPWDEAWKIVTATMAYTNHTLLPEALETWPGALMWRLLPRPMQIIEEINRRFLAKVAMKWPGDVERQQRLSIIGGHGEVRMAHLAIVGSFSVNGVAALHSELLKDGLFNDFYQLWPEKFNNKTNGVTPRRWMAAANPGLRALLDEVLGEQWVTDLSRLSQLEGYLDDPVFRQTWRDIKLENKQRLAALIERETGVRVSSNALFDVQVKRIHEYKRQLLNALHVIHLYARIKRGDTANWVDRVVVFGGKAAPGYHMAKKIIKLINNIARVVNGDPEVGNRLKVVFIPNYSVSAMEVIAPGTDLSEQVSTAGKEASGTGNMKFMMNGAVTIGTLDGANVEIREEVGEENFFLFGLHADEVQQLVPHYNPQDYIDRDSDLQAVMHLLESGHFNQHEYGLFDDLIAGVKAYADPWVTLADFRSYVDVQEQAAQAFADVEGWTTLSILNTARSGKFSTDRTMQDYNNDIWQLQAVEVS
ncbi:glycogen/starch/alpha-glucan phosphorylase [Thiopseudomonas denitrificans]|uniref:Alpha-1,4 glucan phosphorylase n=1 Tax=Thiopseudomonas denitrificans TaxID=1501432 RepID=A0A4R6TX30_9GAMM|nr:glycogen/starch/alpha-glucan phosphorylase [Thiopseudomonas denitrificans]TDQ38440.1 starch phosphorylase [Thiopseudomonas denitrificans]